MESMVTAKRDPSEFLAPGWATRLGDFFKTPEMEDLRRFLAEEYAAGQVVYPSTENVFRALRLVDFEKVKVVILGQDPYHGPGQAIGMAFAVGAGVTPPPSLRNIFKEVANDLSVTPSKNPSLEGWANQGVLLLNTVLTVRAAEPNSHRGKGWEAFTSRVVEELNHHTERIVFLLWGSPAQSKASLIKNKHHVILKAPHPSPLSAHRGFLGCHHFSLANQALVDAGREPIDWALS